MHVNAMRRRDAVVRLIAVFKLTKGLLLLAVGLAFVLLRHRDIPATVDAWAFQLHLDPDGHLARFLLRVADLNPRRIVAIGAGMLFYAALLLTEGVGLLLRKRWAEAFTVIVTASFIPFELYELLHRTTWVRTGVLILNMAIVGYLIMRLQRRPTESR